MVKNQPANAGDAREAGSICRSERSHGVGSGNHSSILAWKISWTVDPGRLQFTGCKELDVTECTHMRARTCTRTHTHRVLRTQLKHSRRMFKESKKD